MDNIRNFKEYEEKWITLVRTHKSQLQACPVQTPKICLEAVKFDGWALQFVKKQTKKLCKEAIKSNPYAINFVKNKTFDICFISIINCPATIQYLGEEEITDDLIQLAISVDPSVVKYIRRILSKKHWIMALSHKWGNQALEYVPFEFRKENLKETLLYLNKKVLKEKIENLNE